MDNWPTRILPHTDITVGPCAWRLPMLAGDHRGYVLDHPSLIVVDPSDDDTLLAQAGPHTAGLPVLLGVAEPAFARQLEGAARDRMRLMKREYVEALVLYVDDPSEVKSGGMLQTMFALREQGVVGHIGLAHPDPRVAEWLSINTAVRLIGMNYSLEDPSARHRALPSAEAFGMSAYTLDCPGDDRSIGFAMAEAGRILPVLDRPIPAGVMPWAADELEQAWNDYNSAHPPPPPLERGKPPVVGD